MTYKVPVFIGEGEDKTKVGEADISQVGSRLFARMLITDPETAEIIMTPVSEFSLGWTLPEGL